MMPPEQDPLPAFIERVLAAPPAWPWPLIEEEARRRAEKVLAIVRRGHEEAPADHPRLHIRLPFAYRNLIYLRR